MELLTTDLAASASTDSSGRDTYRLDTLYDARNAIESAVEILNDLLVYDRLEAGVFELHREDVSASALVVDNVSMFQAQAREKGIALQVSLVGHVPDANPGAATAPLTSADLVWADKNKLQQVVRNLVSNACKFSPRGASVLVTASFEPDPDAGTQRELPGEERRRRRWWWYPSSDGSGAAVRDERSSAKSLLEQRKASTSGGGGGGDGPNGEHAGLPGRLVVTVADGGVGFGPAQRDAFFKEWSQFTPGRLQAGGGSGLGLFICKRLVELHGGRIGATSEGEGKGATFWFEVPTVRTSAACTAASGASGGSATATRVGGARASSVGTSGDCGGGGGGGVCGEASLPAVPRLEGEGKADAENQVDEGSANHLSRDVTLSAELQLPLLLIPPAAGPHAAAPGTARRKVLIVDDDKMSRRMLRHLLELKGYACDEAPHGNDAVTRALADPKGYDCILMDYVMAHCDGPTATARLRAGGYTRPIFGLTGNGLSEDVLKFKSLGADKVLVKPFDYAEFERYMETYAPPRK